MFKQLLAVGLLAGCLTVSAEHITSYDVQQQINATLKRIEDTKKVESIHSQLYDLDRQLVNSHFIYSLAASVTGVFIATSFAPDPCCPAISNEVTAGLVVAFFFSAYNAIQNYRKANKVCAIRKLVYEIQPN
jgi:hypothetical protein